MSTVLENKTAVGALIGSIDYVSVMVKDQAAAARFYTEVLGFEPHGTVSLAGVECPAVSLPGGGVKLALYGDPHAQEDGGCCGSGGCGSCGVDYVWTGTVLGTGDIQSACEELGAKGVTILQPPKQQPWGVIEALLSDPDGNVYTLAQRV